MANARDMVTRALRVGEGRKFKSYEKRAEAINRFEPEMELLDDEELRAEADSLRERARGGESLDDLLPEAFALTREAARRTLGQRHYDVQLIGGMVLHDGSIAEMKTGEGKTLTATLAVFLNTLGGDSGPRRHRQRLPRPPRRRMDVADLRGARGQRLLRSRRTTTTRPGSGNTPATSPTGPTPSSASTTCATTWRRRSSTASSAATTSRSWTRSTTS